MLIESQIEILPMRSQNSKFLSRTNKTTEWSMLLIKGFNVYFIDNLMTIILSSDPDQMLH